MRTAVCVADALVPGPWPVAVPRWWRRISAENPESGPDLHKRRSCLWESTHDLRITRRRRATPPARTDQHGSHTSTLPARPVTCANAIRVPRRVPVLLELAAALPLGLLRSHAPLRRSSAAALRAGQDVAQPSPATEQGGSELRRRTGSDPARLVRPHGELDPVPRAELGHEVREVRLHGAE